MNDKQTERFIESRRRFRDLFGYFPNHPNEIDFDVEVYIKLLEQCISEDFDYTIKLYGTKPVKLPPGRQPGELIID